MILKGTNLKHVPFAFTEHGGVMAATVLNRPKAIQMSVFVVRAFVTMRGVLSDTRLPAAKLKCLETELVARLDTHETAIVEVLQRLMSLMTPNHEEPPEKPHKEMRFHTALGADRQ